MISLEEALKRYKSTVCALEIETVPVLASAGRVLATDVVSLASLPRFDQSAMDGYAVRSVDLGNASADHPVSLQVGATSAPGTGLLQLRPGAHAIRILTGARVPTGADAVVPQEFVGRTESDIEVRERVTALSNIRRAGEEIAEGSIVGRSGLRITPGVLASLINSGISEVAVRARPRIRVITTGDELRPAGTLLELGQVPDSNGPMTAAMLAHWGYVTVSVHHVIDDADTVRDAIQSGLRECDLTLTTGGASVGDRDYVVSMAESLGVERIFWKVAQKPGKPLYFGALANADGRSRLMMAMPGNPGAVLCCLLVHVRSILDLLEGACVVGATWKRGVLVAPVKADRQRARLMRMSVTEGETGGVELNPLPLQDSHMLSNLLDATALVIVPASGESYPAGQVLSWTSLL